MSFPESIYHAQKMPHSKGGEHRAFATLEAAQEWLDEKITEEPEVERWEINEQSDPYPDYCYEVIEGVGKAAGVIEEVPYAGSEDEKRTNATIHEPYGARSGGITDD